MPNLDLDRQMFTETRDHRERRWCARDTRSQARGALLDKPGTRHCGAPGNRCRDSTSVCIEFPRDLTTRAMRNPVLVISDGAPGQIAGVERVFPAALRQRCLAHDMRNL
jgi:hypothetical protein